MIGATKRNGSFALSQRSEELSLPPGCQNRFSGKRRINVSLDTELLEPPESFGLSVSQTCEQGLADQDRSAAARRRPDEKREAIEQCDCLCGAHGPPLERFRTFRRKVTTAKKVFGLDTLVGRVPVGRDIE